ncbi:uncharacterized protein LOC62_05G006927 [Vanrija pseudolonga]|uniref:Uncharacterized protein n=1 Tax=Vanrija pseudolonga TaxID=143232 RepID=A0AAF0YF45_9TREE|nr:hypothetical protein LOC62_05G006927 [Vanrija pseudolonga]
MDLSALNSSLPPGLADAERDMGGKFRAAALSITTLYKASLASTKVSYEATKLSSHLQQAYQVGYSAALSDVLSKLQSDIGAGADAADALARLMDWSEARQAAMVAFAADEDEEKPSTTSSAAAAASRSQSVAAPQPLHSRQFPASTSQQQQHQRPASAPVPDARPRGFARSESSLRTDTAMEADETPTSSASASASVSSSRRPIAPAHLERAMPEVAPPSSSPVSSPSGVGRPIAPGRLLRNMGSRVPSSSSSTTAPTSSFNFSIPPAYTIPTLELPPASGPAQTGPIGSKRPIVDAEMTDSAPSTPVRGGAGRASKRRSMGLALVQDSEDKERGSAERRRPPRRGGGGGGARAPSPI